MSEDIINKIEESVKIAVKETVNGKITKLHEEILANNDAQKAVNDTQAEVNRSQSKTLGEIKDGTDEIIELFKGLKLVLKGVNILAKFLIPVGGAWGIVWAFIKWIK